MHIITCSSNFNFFDCCICLFVVRVTLLKLSMLHWSVLGKLGLRQLGLGALLSLSNCPWPNLLWACFFLAFLYFLYFFTFVALFISFKSWCMVMQRAHIRKICLFPPFHKKYHHPWGFVFPSIKASNIFAIEFLRFPWMRLWKHFAGICVSLKNWIPTKTEFSILISLLHMASTLLPLQMNRSSILGREAPCEKL